MPARRPRGATARARRVQPGQALAEAQYNIASALLWDLRVLAGWLPRDGVRLLRVLAAWFEMANVDEMLQALAGRPARRGRVRAGLPGRVARPARR